MMYRNAARQIRLLRTKSNLTQAQLAEKLGVTSNYISAIETGARKGSLYFYRDIANYFHVTLDYLFVDSIDIKKNIITDSVILKMSYMEENEQKYILKMVEDFIEYKENNR